MKLKLNDRVQALESHPYLDVSRRHVGIVEEITRNKFGGLHSVAVKFKHKPSSVVFQSNELKKRTK